MFRVTVFSVAFLLMVPQVTLAEWVPVGSGGGKTASVDDGSLTRRGDIVTFWTRVNYDVPLHGISETRLRVTVNCRNGLHQQHNLLGYTPKGVQVINEAKEERPGRVESGTLNGAIAEFACQ